MSLYGIFRASSCLVPLQTLCRRSVEPRLVAFRPLKLMTDDLCIEYWIGALQKSVSGTLTISSGASLFCSHIAKVTGIPRRLQKEKGVD